MYAQLGDIIFQTTFGFSSFQRDTAGRYGEHQLLDGKSRLQKTGDELATISMDIFMHTGFTDPQEAIDKLNGHRSNGSILPLVWGDGSVQGNFLLISMQETVRQLKPTGGLISANVAIVLKEWVDPDPVATQFKAQIRDAIAVAENGVVPVINTAITPSPLGAVVSSVTSARSGSVAAAALITTASTSTANKDRLLHQASVKLEGAVASAKAGIAKLQQVASVAAKAPALLDALETVRNNADLARTYAENGDTTNALAQSQALTDSVGAMDDAVRPLDLLSILRRP